MLTELENKFTQAVKTVGDKLVIAGDVVVVSRLPVKERKTKSGIVMAGSLNMGHKQITGFDSNMPEFVKVLAVGAGYYNDETKEDVKLDVKPGNIIEVGRNSVNWFSSFGTVINDAERGTGIGITRESEYRLRFDTEQDYSLFMDAFEG